MTKTYVYIDDSGTPGQRPPHEYIEKETKIWAAVILDATQKFSIEQDIFKVYGELNREISFTEFHFKDIYSGINEFEGIEADLRLKIINNFSIIYDKYQPYVILEAVGENTLCNTGFSKDFLQNSFDGFSMKKPSDCALYLLLLNIQEYIMINKDSYNLPVEIVIDEGRRKAGKSQEISCIPDICDRLLYQSSKETILLQFIDFLVYSLNRISLNIGKSRTQFDIEFMNIIGKMKWNTNLPGLRIENLKDLSIGLLKENISSIKKPAPSKEHIQYIETLAREVEIMEHTLKKNKQIDENTKNIVLQSIRAIRGTEYSDSEEFKKFLVIAEKYLS